MRSIREQRLVYRFAVGSLVAFITVGTALAVLVSRQARQAAEEAAQTHAEFVTNSILRYELTPEELETPEPLRGQRYRELLEVVQTRIIRLQVPVIRIKIWRHDGVIIFSDDERLVGRRFELEDDVLEAFDGEVVGERSSLQAEENEFEQGLAPNLFETYVPLRFSDATRPAVVVELYTDYAGIESDVSGLFVPLALTLLLGLAILYLMLMPLSRRVARTLSHQNRTLEKQAKWLKTLLEQEKKTVAELRELNKLKGNFIAMASHELRSPLTSIVGYVKTLQRPEFADDPAMRSEFLRSTERQANRLSGLVENLLAASQLESHRLGLKLSSVSFAELAAEAVEGLGPGKDRVDLAIDPDLPDLVSDRSHLARILSNLLDNALKYSPGGQRCQLGARPGSIRSSEALVFWVRDEGIGISKEQVTRVFERFYQVDSSSTRPYGGVGLGLTLVKELVEILGGAIDVQSEPGLGSTFTVTIPVRHARADVRSDGRALPWDRASPGGMPGSPHSPVRVSSSPHRP